MIVVHKNKFKSLKRGALSAAVVLLALAGAVYYAMGTPLYSLYQLKVAIIRGDQAAVQKYLDPGKAEPPLGMTPNQFAAWVKNLGVSQVEIKEENPNQGKNDERYLPTGLTGRQLKKISLKLADGRAGGYFLQLEFDPAGTELLTEITRRNSGKKIALFLEGKIMDVQTVQAQIKDGRLVTAEKLSLSDAQALSEKMKQLKNGAVGGFHFRSQALKGDSAEIELADSARNSFQVKMVKTPSRYWKISALELTEGLVAEKLPPPQQEKTAVFAWSYKGKKYSLEERLYESYYQFYAARPAESLFNGESLVEAWEKNNALFVAGVPGDKTISELARSLKGLGEKNKLSEDQIVELVATFVQTIPYDLEEAANIDLGKHKVDYPYEVLYKNSGICSDKSYLAYALLRELGYGASFFLFPEDRHIAVGIQCPVEYSNYDSGYCFLETTSLGNKIGATPSIMEGSRIASAKIELNDFGFDPSENQSQPLGKIEILNKTEGQEYRGIIDTYNTQKEIDRLSATLGDQNRALNQLKAEIGAEEAEVKDLENRLEKMAKSGKLEDYNDLYAKYSKAYSRYEGDIKAYNRKIAAYNQTAGQYNQLIREFYQ